MIFKFDFLGKFQACAGLFHNVPNYMGGLHLVLPGLNLYTLDASILIMVMILVSAPVPFLVYFGLNLVGLGWNWGLKETKGNPPPPFNVNNFPKRKNNSEETKADLKGETKLNILVEKYPKLA